MPLNKLLSLLKNPIHHHVAFWPCLALILGLSISLFTYFHLSHQHQQEQTNLLDSAAQTIQETLQNKYQRAIGEVNELSVVIASQKTLEPDEFTAYAERAMAKEHVLDSLQWQPLVREAERHTFEASIRKEGLVNFQLIEPGHTGFIPAKQRTEYVPILFAWPKNTSVVGLDLAFAPSRIISKYQARDTGQAQASATFITIDKKEHRNDQLGLSISAAVYRPGPISTLEQRRERLAGYAAGVVQVGTLLKEANARADLALLDMSVLEIAGTQRKAIYPPPPHFKSQISQANGLLKDRTISFDMGVQTWEITLHPRPDFFATHRNSLAQIALLLGTLFSTLFSFVLYRIQTTRALAQRNQLATNHAETALKAERQHLLNVLAGTDAGTWDWDIVSDGLVVNARWSAMLGYTLDELEPICGRTLAYMILPSDYPLFEAALHEHLNGNTPFFKCEMRMQHKAGNWIWVAIHGRLVARDEQGKPSHLAGIQLEITERKQLLQTLTDIRSALDEHAIMAFTDAKGKITYANDRFCQISKYSREELMGKDHRIINSGHHSKEFMRDMWDTIKAGRPWHGEIKNKAKDGTFYWVNSTIAPILGANGKPEQFIAIRHEITEHKELEARLLQAKEAAEATTKAKSEFLANMSHEIRTPMNGILGMLKLLSHTELNPRQLDYATKSQSAAQSLLDIINDILDFSKVESGKMTLNPHPFELDLLTEELSVMLSANLSHQKTELIFSIDPHIPRKLIGDALRLRQVLLNLAGNAVKFTEQGEVLVEIKQTKQSEGRSTLLFSVKDTGIGIPTEKLDTIFEGFSQAEASTTRRFGGSGLGLAISQYLVHLMGGHIEVESTLDQGSHFYFTIDLEYDPNPPLHATERKTNQLAPDAVHVLVVDDNATALALQKSMIESMGWQCDTASSGQEALALLLQRDPYLPPYDAIFMDWVMPELDGWETAKLLHEQLPIQQTPVVIMVTAHGRDQLNKKLAQEQNQIDGFLLKPVTPSMLFNSVMDATSGHISYKKSGAKSKNQSKRLAGLHLLLVEDNLINQQIARELLTQEGAQIEIANNGSEGVERILTAHPAFDAILMDLQMPIMDGYTATQEIRKQLSEQVLPIIAMTANAMESDKDACLKAGMNDHVSKPFELDELVAIIQKHTRLVRSKVVPITRTPLSKTEINTDTETSYQNALERIGGDHELFKTIIQTFITDNQHLVSTLRQFIQAEQLVEVQRAMHTLKGLASTLGAMPLSRFAADIETQLRHQQTLDHEQWLNELSTLLNSSYAELQQFIARIDQHDQ